MAKKHLKIYLEVPFPKAEYFSREDTGSDKGTLNTD